MDTFENLPKPQEQWDPSKGDGHEKARQTDNDPARFPDHAGAHAEQDKGSKVWGPDGKPGEA